MTNCCSLGCRKSEKKVWKEEIEAEELSKESWRAEEVGSIKALWFLFVLCLVSWLGDQYLDDIATSPVSVAQRLIAKNLATNFYSE